MEIFALRFEFERDNFRWEYNYLPCMTVHFVILNTVFHTKALYTAYTKRYTVYNAFG